MVSAFIIAAISLGILIVSINIHAFYIQRKRPNPGPWIKPIDLAKLTAALSVLFALFLVLS